MKKLVDSFQIGSDIEWFLQDKNTHEIISAEGIIKGSKHDPFHFDAKNDFFATSLDNVMAEGNIPHSNSPSEFYKNVEKLIKYINSTIPEHLQTVSLPSARLDFKHLQTENSQIFGCDPSLNCWTMEEVHPQPTGDNVRSTGFHVHIGYNDPSVETNFMLARAMDLFLGVPAVLLEPVNERKTVGYGLSGNFRHQRHGMEYRSLSGYFSSTKNLIKWCFKNAKEAVRFVNKGGVDKIIHLSDTIQNVINKEDINGARELVAEFKIKLAA